MTLEEAQQRILELTEENQNLKTERDTLSSNNETLKKDVDDLRQLNQKYFNKLIAQDDTKTPGKGEEPDEPVKSCEEFAMGINII